MPIGIMNAPPRVISVSRSIPDGAMIPAILRWRLVIHDRLDFGRIDRTAASCARDTDASNDASSHSSQAITK